MSHPPHDHRDGGPAPGEPATGDRAPDDELAADWHRIRTGVSRIQRHLDETVERDGVPAPWFAVLHMLLRVPSGGLPMNVLARDLGMTSGGFTKLADRMARNGLIDRRGTVGDRRVVQATLTDAGREVAERLDVVYARALREVLSGVLGDDRLADAGRVLIQLSDAQQDTMATGSGAEDPNMLATQRDPALPERRGRGRESE